MKHIAIAAFLVAGLTTVLGADAQTLYTCGQGVVRNVQSVTETVNPAVQARLAMSSERGGIEAPSERPHVGYFVTVQLGAMVYTGRSSADASWNLDPTRLAIGEGIAVCANSAQMVLDRLDGTDYRAAVVRIDRDAKRPSSATMSDTMPGTR